MKKIITAYFFFCLFFFAFFASGFVDSQDGFQYLAVARRIYYDHTFEMPKEVFRETDPIPENIHLSYSKGRDGKIYSPTGLGYSLALLPAVYLEDVFLKASDTPPLTAFPLQSDWPVLLFASLTNSFFGAILAVVMFLYLKLYNIRTKTSLTLSFLSIVTTNLFVYTKHTFPHMMFAAFLVLSFYLVKKYSQTKKPFMLFLAGLSYGLVIITYNPTFAFSAIPLGLYHLLLVKPRLDNLKTLLRDLILMLIGVAPFLILYLAFNSYRFGGETIAGYTGEIVPSYFSAYVIIEGIWNTLISPGRGFFIYSPILITIFIFWHKINKKLIPEIISFGLLFLIYTYFIGTLLGGQDFLTWHGEFSWGPRYMTPLIPFGMILVSNIFVKINKVSKMLVFLPLALVGIYFEILGLVLPYQVKFAGLPWDVRIGDTYLTQADFGNMITRFSPLFKMSKTLVKRVANVNELYNHGTYNLRLLDGFNTPFDLGWATWREVMPAAILKFDDDPKDIAKTISLQFINHQMNPMSKYSLEIQVTVNGKVTPLATIIPVDQEKTITINLDEYGLIDKDNQILIKTRFQQSPTSRLPKDQLAFLQAVKLNENVQNIKTIDIPYVSEVSKNLYNTNYIYWGLTEKNPWEYWYLHSGVYEKTFDIWWLRPYHYWDLPKNFFNNLLAIDISGMALSILILIRSKNKNG